jgi:hypothetical protein
MPAYSIPIDSGFSQWRYQGTDLSVPSAFKLNSGLQPVVRYFLLRHFEIILSNNDGISPSQISGP